MNTHELLVARGREIVQAAPQAFIDLDVEADGIPGRGSLLSVGAISPWGETFYAELRPVHESFIPSNRKFCEEHNLERERLMDEGQDPKTAIRNLARWTVDVTEAYGKQKSILAAFNASFDGPWIDLAMKEADIVNPFDVTAFCIQSLAMALPGAYDFGKTSKSKLPVDIVPPGKFTHNALEDAIYQQKVHFAMVAKLSGE
jgi:hypothetical protein